MIAQKPLTREELGQVWDSIDDAEPDALMAFARAIEAAHGIKDPVISASEQAAQRLGFERFEYTERS